MIMKAYRTFGLLVVISLFLAACGGAAPAATPNPNALPPVVSDALVISEGRLYPQQYADISFNSSGNVAEVLVKEGDTVQTDQVIARLVNSEAEETNVARAQKDADVAGAQQGIVAAQQAVAAAQQELAAAQQAQLAAQVEVVNARKAITDMLDAPATALNLAQAQMDIADLQKQIDDAKRNLGYLTSPNLKYYQDQVTQAQDALTNAQQNVTLIDIGQLQVDLRTAQKQLQTATDVYNNAKDGFEKCPNCEKVWAYDRMTNREDAYNLYADATNRVQQLQTQIDQNQRGSSLSVSTAQDDLKDATNRLNYYLKGPDAIKLTQGQANVSLLQAQLAKAQSDAETLKANNGVDQDKLKAAQDRLATAEASLVSVQARVDAAEKSVAAAQAGVPTAQANLVAAQLKQDSVELKAPFAGTVAVQNLKVGEHVNAGTPMVTLADASQWEVKTDDLTEIEVVKIKAGQAVTVKLDALPEVKLTGVVKSISAKYEEKRGDITYTVTLVLTSTDPQMRWGMTAEVTFEK
jgi:HlyD family secretion protein